MFKSDEIPFNINDLLNISYNFVKDMVNIKQIDDSHGMLHSMDVVNLSKQIYNEEVKKFPHLRNQQHIIYVAAALHDMFDNKYSENYVSVGHSRHITADEDELIQIDGLFKNYLTSKDINVIKTIIKTMSYSTVKKYGFPDLEDYQISYNIVREADLLAAYDFDRCMTYSIYHKEGDFNKAFMIAYDLFQIRMFKHFEDKLFTTIIGKRKGKQFEKVAKKRIQDWIEILNISDLLDRDVTQIKEIGLRRSSESFCSTSILYKT
jgi:HD superfamily phosphodiesterase